MTPRALMCPKTSNESKNCYKTNSFPAIARRTTKGRDIAPFFSVWISVPLVQMSQWSKDSAA
jgi:hypothetical protein